MLWDRPALWTWDYSALHTRGVCPDSNEFSPVVICFRECDYKNSNRVWRTGDTAANPGETCASHGLPAAGRGVDGLVDQLQQLASGCRSRPPVWRGGAEGRHTMKITVVQVPALHQLPLIQMPDSNIENSANDRAWRPSAFLTRIVAKVWNAITAHVPVGYEDGTGFHYAQDSGAGIQKPAAKKWGAARPAGKACLRARWKAMRTSNLNSGGQLVLQWDPSSRPPYRLSPELFSAKSHPRDPEATVRRLSPFAGTRRTSAP